MPYDPPSLVNVLAGYGPQSLGRIQEGLKSKLMFGDERASALEMATLAPHAPFGELNPRPAEAWATPQIPPGQDAVNAVMLLANFIGPKAPVRQQLSLSANLREGRPHPDTGYPMFLHRIYRNGEKIGSASGDIRDDIAYFSWLGATGQEHKLGLQGIRELRELFRQHYPKVTTFTGDRSSGARHGPAASPNRTDRQTVRIPALLPLTAAAPTLADLLAEAK